MRFERLDLIAFGPFTQVSVDFANSAAGVHFIYGPNEAGKSSMLRAITDLLYGFSHRGVTDDFIHPLQQLRVGAKLSFTDGSQLEVIRRKALKNTLRDATDQVQVDEDQLRQHLSGVDRDLFRYMFGINHELLRQGGHEIVLGQGRMSETLFASAAGLARLQQVQQELTGKLEATFKARGSKDQFNLWRAEYDHHQKAMKEQMVTVEAWKELEGQWHAQQQVQREIEQRIQERSQEYQRLARIQAAIPVVSAWRRLQQALQLSADWPLMPEDFRARVAQGLTLLRQSRLAASQLQHSLEQIDQQLSSLTDDSSWSIAAEAIEAMHEHLGQHRKAVEDRAKLVVQKREADERMAESLQRLGYHRDDDWQLRSEIPADKEIRIRQLGNQREALYGRLLAVRSDLHRQQGLLERARQQAASCSVPEDFKRLVLALEAARAEPNPEQEAEQLAIELGQLEQKLKSDFARLPLFAGTLDQLMQLPIPDRDSIDEDYDRLQHAEQRSERVRERRLEVLEAWQSCQQELSAMDEQDSVPVADDWLELKRLRDEGWQLVLDCWRQTPPSADSLEAFLRRFPGSDGLAEAYTQSVQQADAIADVLRRSADRVARKEFLLKQLDKCQTDLRGLDEQVEAADRDYQLLLAGWEKRWLPCGIEPWLPKEMRNWHDRYSAIRQDYDRSRGLRVERDERCTQAAVRIQQWRRLFEPCGIDSTGLEDRLGAWLGAAQQAVDRYQDIATQRRQAEATLAEGKLRWEELQQQERSCLEDWQQWLERWAVEMQRLHLEADALPEQANQVLQDLDALASSFRLAQSLQRRIEGIDRDAANFAEEVRSLASRLAPDLEACPLEQAGLQLFKRLNAVRQLEERRQAYLSRRGDEQQRWQQLQAELAELTMELDGYLRQCGLKSYDELTMAAERSEQRRQQLAQVPQIEEQLVAHANGEPLAVFIDTVLEAMPLADELPARLQVWKQELDSWQQQRDAALEQVARLHSRLQNLQASGGAAAQATACQFALSRLEECAGQAVMLRTAEIILRKAMERYREKNQSPILELASDYFSRMTNGAFLGIQVAFDDESRPILVGVRNPAHPETGDLMATHQSMSQPRKKTSRKNPNAVGQPLPSQAELPGLATAVPRGLPNIVEVTGMSDGTCDQLYLALRLASLQVWLGSHEPIPLVVDDILMNFDDQRAASTLQLLDNLASQTQILFFTHHQHTLELARQQLPPERVHLHTLG